MFSVVTVKIGPVLLSYWWYHLTSYVNQELSDACVFSHLPAHFYDCRKGSSKLAVLFLLPLVFWIFLGPELLRSHVDKLHALCATNALAEVECQFSSIASAELFLIGVYPGGEVNLADALLVYFLMVWYLGKLGSAYTIPWRKRSYKYGVQVLIRAVVHWNLSFYIQFTFEESTVEDRYSFSTTYNTWLTDWLIDWLNDWLIQIFFHHSNKLPYTE